MSLSTTDAVRGVFERAVQEHLQRALRTPEDWDRFKGIQRETDARVMQEQTAFKRDATQRMAEAKQMILREEHSVALDRPLPPWAHKQYDADALDRKAHARVQSDHDRRIKAIRRDGTDAFTDLAADIRARDAPAQEQNLTQSFNQVHSGPKRI
ncbi:hypothetical protein [uncultured Tateyamaria sp.]|uniref:hypothetical protein n=1 Tax=uncultured Tateyamaria sp. TaxID=455651 RepID=UPI00260FC284|nr:hypothetical protein [uncultured Tateyamaria sp.]